MSDTGMMPSAGNSPVKDARPNVRADILPDVHPSGLACGLECSRTSSRMPVRPGNRADIPPDQARIPCSKGLSAAQINILGLLLLTGPSVTQYGILAIKLEQHYGMQRTPEAVRRIVERLAGRGFIRRKQTREGTMHGVSFGIIEDRLCPYIRSPVLPDVRAGIRPDEIPAQSILEEKDRKNLSICSHREKLETLSEEDIAFHWPNLARAGFGTVQIRQIIHRREQVDESLQHIMQGLTFAEWELDHNRMRDAKGNTVEVPLNWVFRILATQGYYPRPSGYISPQEQAERDREDILKREQEARKARLEAEADAWATNLTSNEREAILGPKNGTGASIPDAVRLRLHFKSEIWPKLREVSKEIS